MKLRTKIILMSFITILVATLVSDVVIWRICRDALIQEAVRDGDSESHKIFDEFRVFIENLETEADKDIVNYFFEKRGDDYTVCVKEEYDMYRECFKEEYYNHTVFSAAVFEKYEPKRTDDIGSYFRMEWDRHQLLVFDDVCAKNGNVLVLYHIVDISDTYYKLTMLALGMAVIFLIVILAEGILLRILLGRAFRPLDKLSETAMKIADGNYHERVEIATQDEVGTLAKNFNTMADSVEVSEKKKTLFMGNLTHELKTPLTAIYGYAETMRRIKLSEEDEAEALDYICKECRRLERLSKKMMQLLELEYSEEIIPEEFPVKKLFETVKESCDATAKQREISIVIQDGGEILYADFDLMCDALINLTDNAVKASKKDSEVRLYMGKTENESCIVVEDFGYGISPEEKEQILEPFYMADKSRSRKNGGAGLGLALTSLILRNHKMKLEIESEVGQGTKMKIYNLMKK